MIKYKNSIFFTDTVSSSTTTGDLETLPRFGSGKRKFQRTRTSFVTGQISILERGIQIMLKNEQVISNLCYE